jgi:D-aminopeptidase
MTSIDNGRLEFALQTLAETCGGPGAAVAVLKEGQVLVRHAWGLADRERRIPFTPRTLMPMCSITKQFTCALALDRLGSFDVLDPQLPARLPLLHGPRPSALHLATNQSGLRDYWALTVLCGAQPDGEFRPQDARDLIGRTLSTQFAPGHLFSYSNGNFRLLADMLEERTGETLGDMLRRRLWEPAGMEWAQHAPETSRAPGDVVGYEESANGGYIPVTNRIHWSGDAGMVACLDDMIAWEREIDRRRGDSDAPYNRISAPQHFSDGTPASYGLGLGHGQVAGRPVTGHSGGLRGFRAHRMHVASERLSVVVMMNHEAAAWTAASTLAEAALGWSAPAAGMLPADDGWLGAYLDPSTGLSLLVERTADGGLAGRFGSRPEPLAVSAEGEAKGPSLRLRRRLDDGLDLERAGDNLRTSVIRLPMTVDSLPEGDFWSEELRAGLRIASFGGVPHAGFDGFLGRGPMERMRSLGGDVWLLACRRSLDAPSPWDWTLRVERDRAARAMRVTVGCWLARQVRFERATA